MKWVITLGAIWCFLGLILLVVSYLRSKSDKELWGDDYNE